MAADVVVMDFDNLADMSTDDEPQAYPTGIDMVAVNGVIVFEGGEHTGKHPGAGPAEPVVESPVENPHRLPAPSGRSYVVCNGTVLTLTY